MSAEEFFFDMTSISNYIFDIISQAWSVIMSNWLLTLSFAIIVIGSIVGIIRRIKNIHH